jgi:hypothetical protein
MCIQKTDKVVDEHFCEEVLNPGYGNCYYLVFSGGEVNVDNFIDEV